MASLTQLEYLIAVERFRHFGKAAKACHVSQPTLSMQLHKLEEEYQVVFFDRSKQPILPTPEAIPLIEQAKVVLKESKKLGYLSKNRASTPSGEFRLALIPTIAPDLLPLFLGKFSQEYPKVQMIIEEMTTEAMIIALEQDQIDAGILATPLEVQSVTEDPLYYEPFYIYASLNHPMTRYQEIQEHKLDSKDIWLLAEGHCLRNQVVRICSLKEKPGVFSNVRFQSGSLETVKRLVEQGYGYTLLPELSTRGLKTSKRGALRPFSKPIPSREISLVYRRSQFKKSIIEALKTQIKKSLPDDLPQTKSKAIEIIQI